ncbi:hypothetical protein C3L23_06200 [Nautilia sp. PV-1]|uniref:BRCT domain-containing protein n=1 Tax=Nautilia sp. PV-1 TaxID=2579250 RepID=UPI000FDB4081|nr:BRCT domain-containing protein [Nautilia sp. PV-1]AZV46878.1 hypothetical protein C3L23_06200 [Nautilia sp. PV-1]
MKYYQDLNEINKDEIKFTRDDIFDDINEIEVGGNFFVLTGTFTSGKRKDIENLIKQYGGKIQKDITKSTDYLVVGEVTTRDWKYGNYGTKIEKALEWKKQIPLKIIPEQVLMKSLKNGNEKNIDEYKDEIFGIFLNLKERDRYETVDYPSGKIIIHNLEDEIENYTDFIFSKLKGQAIEIEFHLSLIKYAYNKLNEKEKIEDTLKEKLINYLKNSLSRNLKSQKSIQQIKENFGPFANTLFFKKQIEKFSQKESK